MKTNEIKKIANPWSAQVELTEGCNRNCEWCGVSNVIKEKTFMTLETARHCARQLNSWLPNGIRIEFAMAGEPLLNKNYLDIIKIFRFEYPKAQLQITTNGILLLGDFEKKIMELYGAGIDLIVLDMYEPEAFRIKEEMRKSDFRGVEVLDFYTSRQTPYKNYRKRVSKLFLMGDISKQNNKRTNRVLFNHAGNVNKEKGKKYGIKFITTPLKKKCTNVFRELAIKTDGAVQVCCMDFSRRNTIGNLNSEHLYDIWNSKKYNAIRALLFRKQRLFSPCNICDYPGGFRQGIGLFDTMPDKNDNELIKIICG